MSRVRQGKCAGSYIHGIVHSVVGTVRSRQGSDYLTQHTGQRGGGSSSVEAEEYVWIEETSAG